MLFLHLLECFWVRLHLSLDRFNVLLCLSVLKFDAREHFTDLSKGVNVSDVFALTGKERGCRILDLSLLGLIVTGIVDSSSV